MKKTALSFLVLFMLSCVVQAKIQSDNTAETLRESPARQLSVSAPTPQPETMVVCGSYGLNVRTGAGTQNEVVSILSDGTVVTLTGKQEAPVMTVWYEIDNPVQGWISGKYICHE